VNQVVDDFRSEVEGRGFVVRWAAEPGAHVIRADGEALGRAVWNLLDNAAKYSGDSRVIDVHVGASTSPHAAGAGRVAIAIRDFGLGIPRSEQTRVFQKFVRGEAALAAGIKGTGIGLTMARHIVAAHGGRLLLQSEPGHGSTFTIELPREPA
jgi:two-component system phosphate regulon sensor histidine kinase PhoR